MYHASCSSRICFKILQLSLSWSRIVVSNALSSDLLMAKRMSANFLYSFQNNGDIVIFLRYGLKKNSIAAILSSWIDKNYQKTKSAKGRIDKRASNPLNQFPFMNYGTVSVRSQLPLQPRHSFNFSFTLLSGLGRSSFAQLLNSTNIIVAMQSLALNSILADT